MSDHPDLEALSADLDGGGDPAAAAHVSSCDGCRARLAELAAVQAAIRRPVAPPAPEVRDRSIAAALAVAGAGEEEPAGGGPAVAAPVAPVELASRARTRWWLPGSAAAAVLAIVVLTVAVIRGGLGGGGDEQTDTALSGGRGEQGTAALESGVPPPAQTFDAGDLGDVADVATLRSRVGALAQAGGRSAAPAAPTPPGVAADAAAPQPSVVGTRVCEAEARTARPSLGVVVYSATLRWQGTPAVVLGFADRPGGQPVTLLVLAPSGQCRVLAESTTP